MEIPEVGVRARTYCVEDVPVEQGGSPHHPHDADPDVCPDSGSPEEIVLISAASPVLDLADAFHDIFDAVTSAFRFVPAVAL